MIFAQAPAAAVALAGMIPDEGGLYFRPADGWLYRWNTAPAGLGDLAGFFSKVKKVKKAVKKVGSQVSKGLKSAGKAVKKGWNTVREAAPILLPIAGTVVAATTGFALAPAIAPLAAAIIARDPKVPKEKAQQLAQKYVNDGAIPEDLLPYLPGPAPELPPENFAFVPPPAPTIETRSTPPWLIPAAVGLLAVALVVRR